MNSISELAKRADQRHPGWYQNIDTEELQMGLERKCVVGQWVLNGEEGEPESYSYLNGLKELFGMRPTDLVGDKRVSTYLSNNVEEWKEEILARQDTTSIMSDEVGVGAFVTTS